MAAHRRLLVADAGAATARALVPVLRRHGWTVQAAADGARALEAALLRPPDVVLFDEACPLLDVRTFARILRANPRTAGARVVQLGGAAGAGPDRPDAVLAKPARPEEALALAEQLWRRAQAARAAAGPRRELEGNLAQLPLADLLQVLGQNRRSGRLELSHGGAPAHVLLREGRVVDAASGPVGGEKALFRLLARREGHFAFRAGEPEGTARIDRSMEELLLEGFRQADEAAALRPALPPADEVLERAVPDVPEGLTPAGAGLLALLARPLPLAELLDRAPASDLEVLRGVASLLERGLVRRGGPAAARAEGPLLGPEELHRLRARIARGRRSGAQAVGKVVLAGGGPLARRAALARLAAAAGLAPAPEPAAGLGTVGRLDLGDGLSLDLAALPLEEGLLPAWRAFAAGALGALVLLPAEGFTAEHAAALRDLHLPAVACGPSPEAVPAALAGGAVFTGPDAAEALRLLLAGAGRPPGRPPP